jgi:uncharacterized protein
VTALLDGNALVALAVGDHLHHDAVERWFADLNSSFATCPITEGTLVRLLVRYGSTAQAAGEILRGLHGDERHEFWADEVPYTVVPTKGIIGHRQVTDAYLAQLTRHRQGRLCTFDGGLAQAAALADQHQQPQGLQIRNSTHSFRL